MKTIEFRETRSSSNRLTRNYVVFVFALLTVMAALANPALGQTGRNPQKGLPNFGKVDDTLYRGAQPDLVGIRTLKRLGIKSIINLRMTNDVWSAEATEARALGLTYTNVPMNNMDRPTDEQVKTVLALIQSLPAPVFVHCQFGCDRTGTIVSCYRISRYHWSGQAAQREADSYGMSGLQTAMKAFIVDFAKRDQGGG